MERRLRILKSELLEKNPVKAALLLTGFLALLLFAADQNDRVYQIERNPYGEGSRSEILLVEGAGRGEGTLEIEIGELEYTKEELQEILHLACAELEQLILGENKSLDHVSSDLNLISRMPESNIEVNWELSDYASMDVTGKIQADTLSEEGAILEVTAILTCQNETIYHVMPVHLYPPDMSKLEKWIQDLRVQVSMKEMETRTDESIILPEEYQGQTLYWRRPKEQRWISVLFLGAASAGLLYLKEREEQKQEKELRKKQMMLDYSGIVNKLTIYTGAGMTLRNAWGKIVQDYEKNQRYTETRHAYEEMVITWHELGDGGGERDCYERFGSRCQVQAYVKLGVLLGQNLKKGTKGLSEQLRLEAASAFEERKQLAKKQGEEVGTKLLIPMFGMLTVVLIIVIVPAFLSLQI